MKKFRAARGLELFRPTQYAKPPSVRETAFLLARTPGAKLICGGTDVLVERDPRVTHLVDLNQLPLNYIRRRSGSVAIGATTTIHQIELSSLFRQSSLSIIYDAVRDFGTYQVRNMASIGGNLCNGIPSADMPPPLIALDATVKLTGPQRSRSIPLQDLYRHVRRLTLRKGELLTEIVIPKQPPRTAGAYIRLTRAQVDIALVSAAVKITLDKEETISDCRIVLGAVAPTPLRAHKAETFLRKKPLRESIIERTGQIAAEECQPITDLRATADYRRAMAATLVDRAAKTAISRIGEGLN